MAQTVKNLPAVQKTGIPSLGQEDSPGEGNGNPLQNSCLENPWTEEPGGQQSMASQRVGHNLPTKQQIIPQTVHGVYEHTLGSIQGTGF